MSPTWADIVANDVKSPQTQSSATRNPRPTKMPERSDWGPNLWSIKTKKPKIQFQQQKADSIGMNQENLQDREHTDKAAIMHEIEEYKPSPQAKAETVKDTDQPKQDTPVPEAEARTAQIPSYTRERTTIESHGQLRNGMYHEIRSETRSQIVDDYFRSPTVQDALSHIICADALLLAEDVRDVIVQFAREEPCKSGVADLSGWCGGDGVGEDRKGEALEAV